MMKNLIKSGTKLLTLLLLPCSVMAQDNLSLSLGYEQTSGSYGLATDTDITTIPLVIQYTSDVWRFRMNIPYISVTGDGSVIPGVNGPSMTDMSSMISGSGFTGTTPTTQTQSETQSGLGDITTGMSYAYLPENSQMFYELTAEVKWGTANAQKYLGTGENDYTLSVYSSYEKYAVKPFVTLGYVITGDTDVINYNNTAFVTAGLMAELNDSTFLSVAYDGQQAVIDGNEDAAMLSVSLSKTFDQHWSANIYVLNGLSNAVADSGAGVSLIRRY